MSFLETMRDILQQEGLSSANCSKPEERTSLSPGCAISWHGSDGTVKGPARVDFIHVDSDGSIWAFCSLPAGWCAVNTKYLTKIEGASQRDILKNEGFSASNEHGSLARSGAEWLTAWRVVAALTNGITSDDARLAPLLAALERCDAAFTADDWSAFERATQQVQRLVQSDS